MPRHGARSTSAVAAAGTSLPSTDAAVVDDKSHFLVVDMPCVEFSADCPTLGQVLQRLNPPGSNDGAVLSDAVPPDDLPQLRADLDTLLAFAMRRRHLLEGRLAALSTLEPNATPVFAPAPRDGRCSTSASQSFNSATNTPSKTKPLTLEHCDSQDGAQGSTLNLSPSGGNLQSETVERLWSSADVYCQPVTTAVVDCLRALIKRSDPTFTTRNSSTDLRSPNNGKRRTKTSARVILRDSEHDDSSNGGAQAPLEKSLLNGNGLPPAATGSSSAAAQLASIKRQLDAQGATLPRRKKPKLERFDDGKSTPLAATEAEQISKRRVLRSNTKDGSNETVIEDAATAAHIRENGLGPLTQRLVSAFVTDYYHPAVPASASTTSILPAFADDNTCDLGADDGDSRMTPPLRFADDADPSTLLSLSSTTEQIAAQSPIQFARALRLPNPSCLEARVKKELESADLLMSNGHVNGFGGAKGEMTPSHSQSDGILAAKGEPEDPAAAATPLQRLKAELATTSAANAQLLADTLAMAERERDRDAAMARLQALEPAVEEAWRRLSVAKQRHRATVAKERETFMRLVNEWNDLAATFIPI